MKDHVKLYGDGSDLMVNKGGYTQVCSLDQVPANVSYLAPEPNKKMDLQSIYLRWSSQTQHLKIENFQPSEYYEDYLMTTSYSKQMQELQSNQVDRLIKLHGKGNVESLIEIGCGDGSFLNHAKCKIGDVWGIEPSERFSELAKNNGHNVINGFVSASLPLTKKTFDAFVSRQVFEHLTDPLNVLTGIKSMLNTNAIGLIEVPNGYRAIQNHRFYEFFPDHVNYFSVNSLVGLASDAGFNVIGCHESFGGDYLELWVRNVVDVVDDIVKIEAHRLNVIDNLKKEILRQRQDERVVAIWGCGAKTLTIFAAGLSEISDQISFVIDSDPNKHGLYIPNTAIKIISPEECISIKLDTIIVLALSYRKEIADSIRDNFPTCSLILTVDDFGDIATL